MSIETKESNDSVSQPTNKVDMVNHPPHYTSGGIETIDFMRAKLSPKEFIGYLRGNIIKYASRLGLKDDPVQDAGKIEWYAKELKKYIEEIKS